eukprot:Tbor_TRINITY_DN5829_c0_g4::TRINITY_DN5829_c0_g4_i1::g.7227::m.7227
MKDSNSALTRSILGEWKTQSRLNDNSHRAQLLSLGSGKLTKSQKNSPKCLVTGKYFIKRQQIQLSRIRSGHSELFGYHQAQLLGCPNACRFCTTLRKPPSTSPATPVSTPADTLKCSYCPYTCKAKARMQTHQRTFHAKEALVDGKYQCEFCKSLWANTRKRGSHYKGCKERAKALAELQAANAPPEPADLVELQASPELAELPLITEETIPHFLSCSALEHSRQRYGIEDDLNTYGKRYFYSVNFLT